MAELTPKETVEALDKYIIGQNAAKRAAAIEWLDRLAGGHDIADFEGLCDGKESMADLKGRGIPTRLLKKVKTTTRTCTRGGNEGTSIHREVELNERGGQAVDRILDRTVGKAVSRNEHSGAEGGPIPHTVTIIHEFDDEDEGDDLGDAGD